MNSTKRLTYTAVLIALSAALAGVKPFPFAPSIAFDSAPAVVGCILLGLWPGMCIAAIGHLVSAMLGGWYMGITNHFIVAGMMMLVMAIFHYAYRLHKAAGFVAFVIANGVISLTPFIFIMGWGFFVGMVGPLSAAALANAAVAIPLAQMLLRYGFEQNART